MPQSIKIREEEILFEPGAFTLSCESPDIPKGGKAARTERTQVSWPVLSEEIRSRMVPVFVYLSLKSVPEVRNYIRTGFDVEELSFTTGLLDVSQKELADKVGISTRTVQRKLKEDERLSPEVSDRLFRIQKVSSAALALFEGNVGSMRRWLKTPLPVLDGETPLAYSDTEPGAQFVMDLINRLEHGVFS